jgi:pyrophosphatase PpaX
MTAASEKKALLLDLDGTVVDTHELIFQSYDHAMRSHCGCEGSRQILQQCTGLHLHDIFAASLEHFGVPASDQLLAESVAIYRDHLRANEAAVSTFPGMRNALVELVRRGWRLGIVTTKPREGAHTHLQSQDLTDLFEVVITGDQCANLKPHPEPFLKGLEALGVDSRNAIGVGDSEHDIRSARAAGLMTVAACWGTLSREKLLEAGPDIVAERPVELLALS